MKDAQRKLLLRGPKTLIRMQMESPELGAGEILRQSARTYPEQTQTQYLRGIFSA